MKRQLILFCIFTLLLGFCANAQENAGAIFSNSSITFDETEYQFGSVDAGEKVQHIYRFTNTGDEPLLLTNARGSCGCTVPSWPKDPIEPGESGAIVVEFDSKGKSGPQTKQVTISANTGPEQTILYIKGEVKSNLENEVSSKPVVERPAVKWPVKEAAYEASIYPNPTSGDFWLKAIDADGLAASVEVFNKNGQLVDKTAVDSIDGAVRMDATNYVAGNYWVSVKIGDAERISLPFVVAK